ncbi:hypothetical protein KUL118_04880 [Tenacibaculum sp. KUL118]|nr:hypothetical protein KUL118_04880 [Tenacibaculum sp. KUL118]
MKIDNKKGILKIMKTYLLFFLLTTLTMVVPVSAKNYITSEQLPEWFNKSLSKEAKDLPQTRISLPAFPLNAIGVGTWSGAQSVEDYWYFTVDIGSETPVECWAFKDYDGLANSLINMMKFSITNISTTLNKAVESQYNFSLDISTLGSTPVFSYNILYNLGDSDERVAGLIKGMSAESANGLQVCLHNEIGYRDTFKNVFNSFVNAVDKTAHVQPFFFAINGMTMQGELVGIVSEKFSKDADGDVEIVETTSLILPVDANTVSSTDSVVRSWGHSDGTLINSYAYTVENGELSSSIGVSRPEEKWVIDGEIQGKSVSSELLYDGVFISNFGTYLETQKLANSDNDSTRYNTWSVDADPTQPTSTVMYKKGQKNGLLELLAEIEGFKVEYTVDEDFIMQEAQVNMGPIEFDIIPMYVSGKPTNL